MKVAMARLRYMSPEHIAKDFRSARERAAIAAVFKWLSLNAITAWPLKRYGHYATVAVSAAVNRKIGTSTAMVLGDEQYDRARKVLGVTD
jgi:hypothetical protein